jgi:c-di-GMP-binding flagellar brake protein YcgR
MRDQNGKTAGLPSDQKNGDPQERRQWTRYALRDARGRLIWGEGEEHSTCEMTVVNISGGGAAVLADLAPPADHTVWLRLESDFAETKPWEVRLVASSVDTSGKLFLRFRFVSWVPLDAVLKRHQERRLWQRYPARETRATLAWYEQDIERTIPAELLNISGGGAAIITEVEPPADQPLWLGLESKDVAIVPTEARLVVISADPSGLKVVRLRFVDSCPMEMFELAMQGSG